VDNWLYLFGAYTVAWVGIAFYIFINSKKLKVAEKKIEDFESSVNGKR
jgi:CcmD family protein